MPADRDTAAKAARERERQAEVTGRDLRKMVDKYAASRMFDPRPCGISEVVGLDIRESAAAIAVYVKVIDGGSTLKNALGGDRPKATNDG